MQTEAMTAGQMKQLTKMAANIIPSHMSKQEAELLIMSGDFWTQLLVQYRHFMKHVGPYQVPMCRGPMKWLFENCHEFDLEISDAEVMSTKNAFRQFARNLLDVDAHLQKKAFEVCFVNVNRGNVYEGSLKILKNQGYRSATLREAVSFLAQYGQKIAVPGQPDLNWCNFSICDGKKAVHFTSRSGPKFMEARQWTVSGTNDIDHLLSLMGGSGLFLAVKEDAAKKTS